MRPSILPLSSPPVVDPATMLPTGLRGDYSHIGSDYVVVQDWQSYGADEHDRWRRLYSRQLSLLPGRASPVFERSLARLDIGHGIPRLDEASHTLSGLTGWQLVGVPGLLPERAFFGHLAERRFPVTVWLRQEHEFDYIVEPDIFHDFFGHVPLLAEPDFADLMESFGRLGLAASSEEEARAIGRLYWHTVEFGLVESPHGVRAYGAGLMSSPGELAHCLGPVPERVPFDSAVVMASDYRIDTFQSRYCVIRDFGELRAAMAAISAENLHREIL